MELSWLYVDCRGHTDFIPYFSILRVFLDGICRVCMILKHGKFVLLLYSCSNLLLLSDRSPTIHFLLTYLLTCIVLHLNSQSLSDIFISNSHREVTLGASFGFFSGFIQEISLNTSPFRVWNNCSTFLPSWSCQLECTALAVLALQLSEAGWEETAWRNSSLGSVWLINKMFCF